MKQTKKGNCKYCGHEGRLFYDGEKWFSRDCYAVGCIWCGRRTKSVIAPELAWDMFERGEVIDSDPEDWDLTDIRFTSAEEQREILRMAGEAFASGLQKGLNEKGGR